MVLDQVKFLFDENVPRKLFYIFKDKKLSCTSIDYFGWKGIKNGPLCTKISEKDYFFLTRDKDFTFYWKKYQLRVIYLAIQPATLKYIAPRVEEVISNWNYDITKPFLLIIQENSVRYWSTKG